MGALARQAYWSSEASQMHDLYFTVVSLDTFWIHIILKYIPLSNKTIRKEYTKKNFLFDQNSVFTKFLVRSTGDVGVLLAATVLM